MIKEKDQEDKGNILLNITATTTLEELAVIVSEYLKSKGIEIILVGGACVSIYSKNAYISGDLDLITYQEGKKIKQYLEEAGFRFTTAKYFTHNNTKFIIEFVNPPIAVGNEPVTNFHLHKIELGEIKLLTSTDTVKDRLSAYYYWEDTQSLEQALLVCKETDINIKEIQRWSEKEKMLDKFKIFLNKYKVL